MSGLIDKGVEAPQSFEDGMREAEAAAEIPSDAELYGEAWAQPEPDETGRVPSPSPPRDEDGTPVPVEEPAEAEEPTDEPVDAPEPAAPDPVILAELQELKSKVGTLVNENAELRRMQEQAPVDLSYFDQAIEENPAQAVGLAIQAGDAFKYDQALRAWYDVDPVAAGRFERQAEMAQMQQQMQATFAPQLAGANTVAQRAELEQAINTVKANHEDFDAVMGPLDQAGTQRIIESGFPVRILEGLSGDIGEKVSALETLYRWTKAETAGTIAQAAAEVQAEVVEEGKARKRAATVASASTTTPPVVEESEGERLARVWKESRPSLRDGWTGRPGQ